MVLGLVTKPTAFVYVKNILSSKYLIENTLKPFGFYEWYLLPLYSILGANNSVKFGYVCKKIFISYYTRIYIFVKGMLF
jgi:hypothetical protein